MTVLRKSTKIDDVTYNVNYGSLKAINQFKEFIGEDKFNEIVNNATSIDIPFEEEQYQELLNIILDNNVNATSIPYQHAEALVSFFCEPFAGRLLKQAKSTLTGLSSLLQNLDPKVMRTVMESMQSQMKNGTNSAVEN